jgi:fibronectin type 3 domain-containing protein
MESIHNPRMRSSIIDRLLSKRARILSGLALLATLPLHAHPITFNSTISYSPSQPSGGSDSVAQWSGAAFDAANIGGSGVNADGGANNGTANDSSTRVGGQLPQGQTFTTGSNANGYEVTGITVRLAGYTNNTASGANQTSWNLGPQNGPIVVSVGKVNGTTHSFLSIQHFMAGGEGNPGTGSSANGPGTYLTFNLPFSVHLDPNTTYSFDLSIGNGSNAFELLGTSTDPYAGGTAYTRNGATITPLAGDRVFQVNMTAAATPYAPFTHPGALHTQADFDRMKAKIAAGASPWKETYDQLAASPHAQTNWNAYDVDYIERFTSGGNYTRSQHDAQAIYHLALRWKLTGDVAYANHAVQIANVWSGLIGVGGDTNGALATGICGYLFATGGEILSTYPGWPEAEKQAYKDMMMRAFYTGNAWFLWNHFYTPDSKGGNTHYRLNWDTANMASMAAIGILCDNRAVYQQALDYFKFGPGNSRVERAAWYIHPDGTSQTEESGRDQPHNKGGWYAMGLLCQMAWNQGDDLFGYDNNRVLRAYEYNAKYNNWSDVSWVYHRNASLGYTEGLAESGRYPGGYPSYELIYNHYANVKGIAAPWNKIGMLAIRPEGATGTGGHPSAQDHLGLGSLTYARDDISNGAAPSGLLAQWSKSELILSWWGSATATSYQVQRATSISGPYTTLGTAVEPNFTDTTVDQGGSYYYKVVAVTPAGNLESTPLLTNQALVASYSFEGNTNDGTGTRHATGKGTTAPGYATGFGGGFGGGQALSLNGVDQYVQLPVNSALSRDVTLSAWVYWNGGSSFQRVFDFGSEIEKYMMLTPKDGSGKIGFQMTTSRGTDGTIYLTGPTMPTATWTHLAVTFNGETATLYVNGLPVAAGSSPRLAPMFSHPFCYLGKSMWNADPYLNGRIDDFRIYNYGMSGSDVYSLWGQSTNHAPKFTTNPMTRADATQGAAYTTQSIYNTATDVDGGTLIYEKVSGPSWLSVAANGALAGTPANSDNGKNLFVVRVTDSSGATDDANLFITVNNTNEAPTWLSGTIVKPGITRGQSYFGSLTANATDPDLPYGDSNSFSKISGPAWLTIGSNGELTGTPGAGDVGLNTFTVRVTDSSGLFADATLEISVFPFTQRSGYQFDGNLTDGVGNFPGTITGTPTYSSGRTGQALSLDGVTNHVTLPAGVASYHEISISTWVYWNGGGNWQRLFDFGNSQSSYMMLTPNSGGGMRFTISHGGVEQQLNTTALPIGRWVHVAVTLSGSNATLYVNGAAVATHNAITITPDAFNPAFNYIGKSQFADPLFNGRIDDFRIYNYALSAAEVDGIVASIPPPTPGTVSSISGNGSSQVSLSWGAASGATSYRVERSTVPGGPYTTIYTGPATSYADASVSSGVTYYYVVVAVNAAGESAGTTESSGMVNIALPKVHLRFDETTGSTAADASGNNWNGTLVGGSTWTTGRINNAVSLSGTTNYATLPTGVVAGLGDCTLSAWVKVNAFATFSRIFDFGTGTNNYMFLTPQYTGTAPNNAKLRFAIRTPGVTEDPAGSALNQINSSVALSPGTWTHVAVTISGTTGQIYVNGTLAGTTTTMTLKPSDLGVTTFNYLGKSQFGSDPYLNGAVDEFQIYGRALSVAEISALAAPLAAPDGLGVNFGNAQATLTWNAVSGATGYNVKRSTDSGGPYTVVGANLVDPTWTDTGLINGTGYFYVVTALNGVAESVNSSEVSTTPVGPPPVPANFTAISGNSLVTLTWTASSGATSYNIQRSTTEGSGYLTIGTSASATYVDSTVSNGTVYYYVATAVGANGESAASVQATATPLAPPAAPVGLTATASNATVTLAWTASSGATSYNIKRSETSGSGYELISTTSTTGYVDTDVVNGVPYYYVISAQNIAGEGANSTQVTATPVAAPAAPSGAIASAGNGQSGLVWQAVSGATSYTIKRSTVSGGPYSVIASGLTATNYFDSTVVNGTTYYYVITAVNAGGESGTSIQLVVTPNDNPLRAHLRFDELSGANVTDSSGNGWNGTLVNGSTYTAGKINNAVSLSGSSNYATLPTGVVAGLNNLTISAWVKLNSATNWPRLFNFGTGTTSFMYLLPRNGSGNVQFGITTNGWNGQQQINTAYTFPTGTWTHVAVTLSGTVGTVYVNGTSVGTNSAMTLNPSSLGITTQNYIGKSYLGSDPYLNGLVDEFQIYGRALSAAEISDLAAASLNAPVNLVATPGETQVALNWSAVPGATGYNVKRAYVSGGPYTILGSVTGTSYTDTSLAIGSPYYYVVSTVSGVAESVNSAEASAITMVPPPAPSGLAATGGDAQVSLTWTASPGAASYQVKRSPTPEGPYAIIATGITDTSLTDTGLTNGTTYYYVVSASNLGGESANSTEVSALPLPPVPAAPATLTATPGNSTVALAWSAADGADSYNVKRATNSGGPYATLASGLTATSYNDSSAVNETTYYYLVTATNLGGESESSPEVSATPVTPPVAPAGLAATSGDASAALTWSPVSGANGYRLKRATTSGGPYDIVAGELTATSFADTGLTNGTTYYYVVSAFNAGGESADSSQVTAEPQAVPAAPTGLAATTASSSKINLAWNTVSGANSYSIKRATTTGGPYTTLASGLTASSFNDTGLTSATTYYYVVTATSNGGESATSTEASATTSDLRVSLAFDETSGTTANDSAGDNYHATLVNGPLFATGTLGNAVELDGTNDHLTLPTGVLGGLTSFSLSVWVKPDTVTNWSRVFDFGTGTTVNMFLTPKNGANGKVRFAITTGGGAGEQRIDGQSALAAGAWSHVVITWSGNTGILYVNGVEVGRNTAMTLNPSSLGTTNLNHLGRSQYPDPYFDGRIDDFRIYARALGAAEISAATAAQMPLASVSGLQATAASSGQINLSWTANPNATSYNVKRATTPGGPYTTLATGVTATNYSNSGLSAGATYYYVVSATNAGGEGADSAEAGATTFPAAPATLTATSTSSTGIDLTWSASNGATSYTVKRSATSGGTYTPLATGVTGTSYNDTGLTAGATWYYVVSASNTGESVNSTEAVATTFAETPSGLAATVVSSSAIDLTWSATAGATGYDVKRSTSAGGPFDTIASAVTATAFSDSGLNAATTYHYVVSATNAAGASPDSASVNATTLPLPPATPSGLAATPGIGQVSLTWSAVSGATGYTVKRATVSGGPYTVVASDLASPAYTDTGLTNGTTYYYVVNAANTGGTSADSSEVSAVPSGLPSPWVTADIGTTGLAGSAEFANNAYTINGAGSLGGTTDGFRYLYQPLSADGSIIARVNTLEDTGNNARVGIMIRDTLAANSRMATLSVTGSGAWRWQRRTTTGGNVSNTNSSSGTVPNIWVRLVRVGNIVTASRSTNGTTWTTIGSATVTMASSCYIGLAVSSGSTTTLNTSVFDNVTATP